MTGTRWGDREGRRRDILEAAMATVTKSGYTELTMRDVASAAAVSPGTVYTYFAGKEELFAALYAQRLDEFRTAITPACESAHDLEELLVEIADRYLDVYRVFGKEMNIWSLPPDAQSLIDSTSRVLACVSAGIERVAPGLVAQPMTLPFLWASVTGLADHFQGARQLMHAHTWDQLVRFGIRTIVSGLRSDTK